MIAKKYSGVGKYSLKMHTTFYKHSYAKLKGCSLHIDLEACVSSLLSLIKGKDQTIVTCIENVKGNTQYAQGL